MVELERNQSHVILWAGMTATVNALSYSYVEMSEQLKKP